MQAANTKNSLVVRPFVSNLGGLLTFVIGTGLIILALQWMGYDFNLITKMYIGDRSDTFANGWGLWQAMDNLLHRPFDLGYSMIYYGDRSSFGYLVAPYGIAVSMLPVYLLCGNHILTYNLYWMSTFPLTALATYMLVRYLLHTPVLASLVIGMMIAFAQFRFIHYSHPEILATHFFLFALYAFHRLLDTPTLKWAVGLAITFWFTALASSYLGMIFITLLAIILVFIILTHGKTLTSRHFESAVVFAVVALILFIPFILMRQNANVVGVGRTFEELISFAASPATWFQGTSQIYRPKTISERTIFMGFMPLLLTIAAWRLRKTTVIADDEAEEHPKFFTARELITLYGLTIIVSYIFTLGPQFALTDSISIPLPYGILFQLPGYWHMRVPTRFIWMAVTSTAILGAFTLTQLYVRRPKIVYYLILVLTVLVLVIELAPFSGSYERRLNLTGEHEPRWGITLTSDNIPPVYQWLAQQPPGTPFFEFPTGAPEISYVMPDYVFYYPFHGQPTLNGHGTFKPSWWITTDWRNFPDLSTLTIMWKRQIHYVIVHRSRLSPDANAAFNQRSQEIWGELPLISTFGSDEVYELKPAVRLRLEMSSVFQGSNWSPPSSNPNGVPFRTMDGKVATVELPLANTNDLVVQFVAAASENTDILNNLKLKVGDQNVPLTSTPLSDDPGWQFQGTIPASAFNPTGNTTFQFQVGDITEEDIQLAGDGNTANAPGIIIRWLQVSPTDQG